MEDNINEVKIVQGDVLAMTFLTKVFNEDAETVAAVLTAMDAGDRDEIINLTVEENLTDDLIENAIMQFHATKKNL
jgi:hypothetical protein